MRKFYLFAQLMLKEQLNNISSTFTGSDAYLIPATAERRNLFISLETEIATKNLTLHFFPG